VKILDQFRGGFTNNQNPWVFTGEKNDWFKPHMKSWENTEGISGVKIFPRKP